MFKTLQNDHFFIKTVDIICVLHRGKMELICLAYGLSKETVTALMTLYRNTKVKVHSMDGDSDFFNIFAGVLK